MGVTTEALLQPGHLLPSGQLTYIHPSLSAAALLLRPWRRTAADICRNHVLRKRNVHPLSSHLHAVAASGWLEGQPSLTCSLDSVKVCIQPNQELKHTEGKAAKEACTLWLSSGSQNAQLLSPVPDQCLPCPRLTPALSSDPSRSLMLRGPTSADKARTNE